jgi:hypothetical protein
MRRIGADCVIIYGEALLADATSLVRSTSACRSISIWGEDGFLKLFSGSSVVVQFFELQDEWSVGF